jgi:hypothetical protein
MRKGAVLVFVLGILLLMCLMGMAILFATGTEQTIAGNQRISRESFNSADAYAQITIMLTAVLLTQRSTGPEDFLIETGGPSDRLWVCPTNKFKIEELLDTASDWRTRYRDIGATDLPPDPEIVFKRGGSGCSDSGARTTAWASVRLDTSEIMGPGYSLDTSDAYDESGGGLMMVNVVASVRAVSDSPGSGAPASSVVTVMWRQTV